MTLSLEDPLALALRQVGLTVDATESASKPTDWYGQARAQKRPVRQTGKRGTDKDPPLSGATSEGAWTLVGDVSERQALESAVLAMLVRQMAPLVRHIPVADLAHALSSSDVPTAAARMSALLTEQLAAHAPATQLVRAWLESAKRKRELLEDAGGGLTAQEVATIRNVSRQSVERARRQDRLLAVPLGAGNWRFPALQFGDDGQPLPGLETVLKAFQVKDPWMRLAELVAPDPELANRSILSVLREEGDDAVATAVAAVREAG